MQVAEIEDRPREECGVLGVWVPNGEAPVAEITLAGLTKLQHRGQDGAGIAVSDGNDLLIYKAEGLITKAFKHGAGFLDVAMPSASVGVGQVRYGTTGGLMNPFDALQPQRGKEVTFALAHNGNFPNVRTVAARHDVTVSEDESDTQTATKIVSRRAAELGGDLDAAVAEVMSQLDGAGSVIIVTDDQRMIGVRDPWGMRPFVLGKRQDGGLVLASETVAFPAVGATYVRDIEAGEIITISKEGVRTSRLQREVGRKALCLFEYVYLADSDSVIEGRRVADVRRRFGEELAREHPLPEGDDVIVQGVPASGTLVGEGYATASGVPITPAITKVAGSGRSFMAATDAQRRAKARAKLDVTESLVVGKQIVVGEDSVVRGTMQGVTTEKCKEAGATAVHVRVGSPPIVHGCKYGVAISDRQSLLAHGRTNEQMREKLDVTSLGFLSIEGTQRAVGEDIELCMMCIDGRDPITGESAAKQDGPVALGMPQVRRPD